MCVSGGFYQKIVIDVVKLKNKVIDIGAVTNINIVLYI